MVFIAVILVAFACIIFTLINRARKNKSILHKLRNSWGITPENKHNSNDLLSIRSYFLNKKDEMNKSFFIDDITWNDLGMDKVFARINNTQTSVGEEYLYAMLREIVLSPEDLINRNRIIEFFEKNPADRERIQLIIAKLGKKRFCNISDYIFGNQNGVLQNGIVYRILSMVFISSLLLAFISKFGVMLFFISMITNIIMYVRVRGEIIGHLESLGYIVNMIGVSKKLAKIHMGAIGQHLETLKSTTDRIKGVSISSFYMMFYTIENYILEFVKIFFLGEPIAFDSIFKLIKKYRAELKTIYEVLGMLDSYIAVASYRQSIDYYIAPELFKSTDIADNSLTFSYIYHPLINNPVTNSFDTKKFVLITGSNASGKSTFLKTVAINAIFAQTIYTCLAKEYKLYTGKSHTRNAIKLLSMIGYNSDIVTKADERAKRFLESGMWGKYKQAVLKKLLKKLLKFI